jgi:hypothetical protein
LQFLFYVLKKMCVVMLAKDLKAVSQESAQPLSQGRHEDREEEQQPDVDHSAEAEAQTAVLSSAAADVQSNGNTLPIASSSVVEE